MPNPVYAQEQIAPSLITKEQFSFFQEQIAISLFCSQKSIDSLEEPKTKFLQTPIRTIKTLVYDICLKVKTEICSFNLGVQHC